MGIRTVLEKVAPIAEAALAGATAPAHPSEVGGGIDLRPWRERYRPEVVSLLGGVIEAAWLIARVDGTIDRAERRALGEIVRAVAAGGLRADDVDDILDRAATLLLQEGLAARCAAVGDRLGRTGSAEPALRLAVAVAAASNGVSLAEGVTFTALARAAGVADAVADAIARETLAALESPE